MSEPGGVGLSDLVDFDVIVVGAGPAGSVTAYLLAQAGLNVVLVERGESPGAKNLSGGVLYTHSLREVFPDFVNKAPIERRIVRNCITFLNDDSMVAIDYADARLADPVNAVSVLRARFDPWLAGKAEEAGAFLMSGVRVDSLLVEDGRVVGVRAGEDELRSHVVVAADGINSFLCRDAGLRPKEPLNHLAVGVKAVIGLPAATIQERFAVGEGEGSAWACVGDCTQGVGGGGFLYTNQESVSVGVVLRLDDLTASGKSSTDIFDHFLDHPQIAGYLAGGELLEYGCHLVAEGGLAMVGELACEGLVVVGDAAGLTLNTGLTIRGMDLAIGSAIAAAHGVGAAIAKGDVSREGLSGYRSELFAGFVGQDLRTYAKAPAFLERPRMYNEYGQFLADVLNDVFRHDLTPRNHLAKVVLDQVRKSPLTLGQLAGDALAGVRAL